MQFGRPDLTLVPDIGNQEYWDGLNQEKLLLKSCLDCGKAHFFPRPMCPLCHSDRLEWITASGHGRIYSFSATVSASSPYVFAMVTLEEGPTMITNIVDASPEELAIGQDVEVTYLRDQTGKQNFPVFRPLLRQGARQ
jgi:uncharacterized OB-fold protein